MVGKTLVLFFQISSAIAAEMTEFTLERFIFSNNTPDAIFKASTLSLRRLNKTHQVLKGAGDILTDVGNNYEIGTEIYKLQGNEYRRTAFRVPVTKFCDLLAKDIYAYPDIQAHSNLPPAGTCPFPKGHYEITDYLVDVDKIPPYFTGKFRLRVNEFSGQKLIDEINFYFEIQKYAIGL